MNPRWLDAPCCLFSLYFFLFVYVLIYLIIPPTPWHLTLRPTHAPQGQTTLEPCCVYPPHQPGGVKTVWAAAASLQYSWIQDSLIYSLSTNANEEHGYVTALLYNVWRGCNSVLQTPAESFSDEWIHREVSYLISCCLHLLYCMFLQLSSPPVICHLLLLI